MEFDGGRIKARGGGLDPQLIRFGLLFWDRLDFPSTFFYGASTRGDADYLIETGVLRRTKVEVVGTLDGKDILDVYLGAFRALDEREPGRWSLARGENSISFPDKDLDRDNGLLFQLHQAIPVPNKDVPLADILEFKRRRHAEHLALRHHLEDVFQAVRAAPVRPLADITAFEKLELALADHVKVSRETGFKLVLGGLQAKLDLKLADAILPAVTGVVTTGTMESVTHALGVTGLAALYSLGSSVSLKRRRQSDTPFEYVSLFHRDLF